MQVGIMYETFFQQDAWCYWVISIAALLSFVGFIVACICSCRHNENKSEFLGLPGMVTMTRAENEVFDRQPTGDYSQNVTLDAVDNGKRSNTANRSLPDIPKDRNVGLGEVGSEATPQDVIYEAAEMMGDTSELYATVQDKNVVKRNNDRGTGRTNSQESSSLQDDDNAYPYARLNTLSSANDEHPYAQVQSVAKQEVNRQNSFRTNPSQAATETNQPGMSTNLSNPIAPPRTRRSSSHNSLLNAEAPPPQVDIQAANAITGGVQANQDLPYMTPPLLMPFPRAPQPQMSTQQQHFSGDSQDSKGYTSISVREPLANIIAQTKAAHQNRTTRVDPHYATVSDDSDEMYAAIDEQEKIYTSGSETYAQIQPMINESINSRNIGHNEPPQTVDESHPIFSAPQPPSVDSLRHVAHAHSRQASSSSATSSIINPGSPKPEKRQANSPLPPPPPPPPPPPLPQLEVNKDALVYALVDKTGKDGEEADSQVVSSKSLEDMYAKVVKVAKKRDSEEDNNHQIDAVGLTKRQTLMEVSRVSWSSHDAVAIQKREPELQVTSDTLNMDSIEFAKVARIYELDATSEYNFEEIQASPRGSNLPTLQQQQQQPRNSGGCNDPNYEMLRPQKPADENNGGLRNGGIDVLSFGLSAPFKHRQVSNASSEDPGYEKVRLRRRLETDADTDSEPNYESMPHDHAEPNYAFVGHRAGDSDTDPNYESVNNSDPNYESVKYMSMPHKDHQHEPPYEQVNAANNSLDGYEKVMQAHNTDDPNYEKILPDNFDCTDTDDEQYVQV